MVDSTTLSINADGSDHKTFAEKKIDSILGDSTGEFFYELDGNPRQTELKRLKSSDLIFALIGPTGSGKSTFIKTVTGFDCEVGHGIVSCTQDIQVIRLEPKNPLDPPICFVDTPGFDDTDRSNISTFETLSHTLITLCKQGLLLSGLLYFHRISDVRMGGTPLSNIRFFHQLCATELNKLVYVTTMWDLEEPAAAEGREKALVEQYWRPMMNTGCTTQRFLGDRESGSKILSPLIRREMERRSGQEIVPRSKSRSIAHGGEILAGLLVDQWQHLKSKDHRIRRQIRKMSSLGSALTKELSKDDIVILVVGPSGSGKTHFINILLNRPEVQEHQLTGSTHKVRTHRVFKHHQYGENLVLVDTPAIGESHSSEAIGRWVTKLYRSGAKLAGIISLYGISDGLVYQSSVAIRILHLYLGLATPDYDPGMVSFVTTGWDKMQPSDKSTWEKREKSYVGTVCEGIIQEGQAPAHFQNTTESANEIVEELLDNCGAASTEAESTYEVVDGQVA